MRPDELAKERNLQILAGGGWESAAFPRGIFSAHCLWSACVEACGQRKKDKSDQTEDKGDPSSAQHLPPHSANQNQPFVLSMEIKKSCLYQ